MPSDRCGKRRHLNRRPTRSRLGPGRTPGPKERPTSLCPVGKTRSSQDSSTRGWLSPPRGERRDRASGPGPAARGVRPFTAWSGAPISELSKHARNRDPRDPRPGRGLPCARSRLRASPGQPENAEDLRRGMTARWRLTESRRETPGGDYCRRRKASGRSEWVRRH